MLILFSILLIIYKKKEEKIKEIRHRLDIADAPHAVALAYAPELYFSSMDRFVEKYMCEK